MEVNLVFRDVTVCSDEQQSVVVCENAGELTINCVEGTIVMQDANYGRTRPDSEVCPFGRSHNDRTDCIDASTLRRINAECNGKHSCSVPATNAFFGDPCPGTYKYIEATYRCQCGKTEINLNVRCLDRYFHCCFDDIQRLIRVRAIRVAWASVRVTATTDTRVAAEMAGPEPTATRVSDVDILYTVMTS